MRMKGTGLSDVLGFFVGVVFIGLVVEAQLVFRKPPTFNIQDTTQLTTLVILVVFLILGGLGMYAHALERRGELTRMK